MDKVKCLRIYSDAQGESHFGEVEVELKLTNYAPPAPPIGVSAPLPAARLLFASVPVGCFGDWHPTPCRQWLVVLRGESKSRRVTARCGIWGVGISRLRKTQRARGTAAASWAPTSISTFSSICRTSGFGQSVGFARQPADPRRRAGLRARLGTPSRWGCGHEPGPRQSQHYVTLRCPFRPAICFGIGNLGVILSQGPERSEGAAKSLR